MTARGTRTETAGLATALPVFLNVGGLRTKTVISMRGSERGFTLIELLLVVAIIGILASIAIMSILRSRAAANESAAIGSLRTITVGEMAYSASCGAGFFAVDLLTLGVPPPGSTVAYLPPDMTTAATVRKAGYQYELAPSAAAVAGLPDCNGTGTQTGYYAKSEPLAFGTTGQRAFATIAPSNVIWQTYASTAPAEPFAAPATPLQ